MRANVPATILLLSMTLPLAADPVSQTFPPGDYDVIIETVMPHLEENLRESVKRERWCAGGKPLAEAFPVLAHETLRGCRLVDPQPVGDATRYRLACPTGGTTGSARWSVTPGGVYGALSVKLGGKNMTFEQRVTARRLGDCDARNGAG